LTKPDILVIGRYLAQRQADWGPDYQLHVFDSPPHDVPREIAASVEVVVCGGDLPNDLVDLLPRLKLVACFSTGYAGIDLSHLRKRGVQLTNGAGVNAHDVADHAIALFLGWWHSIPTGDRLIRSGGWREKIAPRQSLRGRHAGVIGLGRIGMAIAHRLQSHEMKVRWWGPRDKPDAGLERAESLMELARWSDVLFIATRAVPANEHQINADVLKTLGPQGVIVNISRGFLMDETALISALQNGAIAGAALDVFDSEPTDGALWADLSNVLLSPHVAGFTREGGADLIAQLRENVRRYFAGEALLTPVNDAP